MTALALVCGMRGVEELGFEPKFGFDSLSDDGSEKFMKFMETRVIITPRFLYRPVGWNDDDP